MPAWDENMITPPPRMIWNVVWAIADCAPMVTAPWTITFVVVVEFASPAVTRVMAIPLESVVTVVSPASIVAGPLIGATTLKVTGIPGTGMLLFKTCAVTST